MSRTEYLDRLHATAAAAVGTTLSRDQILVVADYLARDYLVARARAATQPAEGRVYLADLIDTSNPSHVRVLLALLTAGGIRLIRADLIGYFMPEMIEASEVTDEFSTFHFMVPAAYEFSRE